MNNLTVVIPFRNGQATIERLLDSLGESVPVLIVDDLSDTPYETSRANVRVVRARERGYFSGAVNIGIDATRGDVLVLNQDVWLTGNWHADVADWQAHEYAIAGDGVFGHPAWRKGYVQGTCMFLSRAAIDKVGALNAVDYPLWGATCEWQLRACRLGFQAHPVKSDWLHHERGASERYGASISRALRDEPDKQDLFIRTPPAISVIIPCYNYGRFIADALASLFGGKSCLGERAPQTFQSFEVIIVDDASTDNSYEIAKSFADDWKAIRVFRNERNVGTAETVNAGIRNARGKYITILSADDMCEPNRLEVLYRASVANPHSVVYDDMYTFRDGKYLKPFPMADYDFDTVLYKNLMHAGIMYPRTAWIETGGYPAEFGNGREDWAFNVALGAKGYCGVHIKEHLYLYRRERHNRSLRNTIPEWREYFLAKMQATFPELYRGERTKMCCGKNKPRPTNVRSARTVSTIIARGFAQNLPGANGMIALEYLGASSGPMGFTGEETKTVYLFGGARKIGYVAVEDVDSLLGMYHNQKPLFRRAVIKPIEPVATVEASAQTETPAIATASNAVVAEPIAKMNESDLAIAEHKFIDALPDAEPAKPKRRGRPKKNASEENA